MSAQIKNAPCVRMYWRGGALDTPLRLRLEEDVRRGRGSASAIMRRALQKHYGLGDRDRPTPKPEASADVAALRSEVAALREQVSALTAAVLQLTATRMETDRLTAAAVELGRQNDVFRLALLGAVYGDKPERTAAAKTAAAVLAAAGNGGNGNGHD